MKSASSRLVLALVAAVVACEPAPTSEADARGAGEPLGCARCHTPEFQTTSHPPHPGARPPTCAVCHAQTSWRFRLSHPTYALTGAHLRAAQDRALAGKEKQVKCFWCHRGDPNAATTYTATKRECIACHEEDRDDARPDHSTFPPTCESCHSTEAWKPAERPAPAPTHVDAGAPPVHSAAPPPKPAPKPAPRPAPAPRPDVTSNASRRH